MKNCRMKHTWENEQATVKWYIAPIWGVLANSVLHGTLCASIQISTSTITDKLFRFQTIMLARYKVKELDLTKAVLEEYPWTCLRMNSTRLNTKLINNKTVLCVICSKPPESYKYLHTLVTNVQHDWRRTITEFQGSLYCLGLLFLRHFNALRQFRSFSQFRLKRVVLSKIKWYPTTRTPKMSIKLALSVINLWIFERFKRSSHWREKVLIPSYLRNG